MNGRLTIPPFTFSYSTVQYSATFIDSLQGGSYILVTQFWFKIKRKENYGNQDEYAVKQRITYIVSMLFNPFNAPGSISEMLLLLSVLINRQTNRGRKIYETRITIYLHGLVVNHSHSLHYDLQKLTSPERIKDTCCNFRQFVAMKESEIKNRNSTLS